MTDRAATEQANAWLARFGAALEHQDIAAAVAQFDATCFWRDLVAFTWNIATQEGRADIAGMLQATVPATRPTAWRLDGPATATDGVVEAWLLFETAVGRGKGHLRLKDGRCWTLLTALTELKGFEERRGPTRIQGTEHGAFKDRKSWLERKMADEAALGAARQPYCLIVGGGQGGLALGARLKRLGVPTIIVDKWARPGDAWRRRYKSLCLHDPVWYDHMPYLPFPDHWPVFTPKDQLGDWLEMYCRVMELNFWASTECEHASFDEGAREWSVVVNRAGKRVTLKPKQLVLATGMSGVPIVPKFPGAERFKGAQHHSSAHEGGAAYTGKRCIVIGSNNSAHDIAADLWEHDADVTMVQRSPTLVVRSESHVGLAIGRLYSEAALQRGITTERADYLGASLPYRLWPMVQGPIFERIKQQDADFYARLRRAGFMLEFADNSGLGLMYMRRGSGYYIDVGASDMVADGRIKLKSGVELREIREHSVVFSDDTESPADLIVYATGYGSMNGWAEILISRAVADKVGKCWGYGSGTKGDPGPWEGELRNMWKPTRQDALWFHGGNLMQSRFYSQFLALQLKARLEGIPTPVHGMAEVHHVR